VNVALLGSNVANAHVLSTNIPPSLGLP